ncbi:uncharacterized protein BP5553_08112 [Venustampulla echinocandica]|uniref:Uncharacterized protein n=1 Tax=Venustampulla echinocandica TaxID=2656787 RepID=A0A370TFR9_9HELO|nr:uncharacterized protein BP5553_08112 [Venustampulla echinocandica]RDL33744.1 hypothetical protein BP5553_08112 [Venustampulla echinocandica]
MHFQNIIKIAVLALPFVNASPIASGHEVREAHVDALVDRSTLCYVNSKRSAEAHPECKRIAEPSPGTLCYVNSKRSAEANPECKRNAEPSPGTLCYVNSKRAAEAHPECKRNVAPSPETL